MRLGLGLSGAPHGARVFYVPSGFSWMPSFKIHEIRKQYSSTFNPLDYAAPSGSVCYVDPVSGSDSAAGTSAAPYKTPYKGITQGCAVIYLKPGYYNYQALGWLTTQITLSTDTALRIWGGPAAGRAVFHLGNASYSYSKTGSYTNIYQTTYNAVGKVIDLTHLDSEGNPIPMTLAADLAACDATPHSYYYSGSTLYIHAWDNRAVTGAGILAFQAATTRRNFDYIGAYSLYAENIDFWGGPYPFAYINSNGTGKYICLNNCTTAYSYQSSSVDTEGCKLRDIANTYLINHKSFYNSLDGVSYQANIFSVKINALELDCLSYNNINRQSGNNNIVQASSAHDGCVVIRLNGYGYGNAGSQFGETGTGTQSLNLGLVVGESTAQTQGAGGYDTGFRCTSGAAQWMKDCSVSDCYNARVNVSATITDLGGFTDGSIAGDSGTIS